MPDSLDDLPDLVAAEAIDEGSPTRSASADREPRNPQVDTLGPDVGPPPTFPSPPLSLTDGVQEGPGQQLAEGEG